MGPCGVVNYTLSQICLSVTYDATSDICFGFRRLFVLPVSQWWNYHYFFNIHPLPSSPCPSGQTFVAENKYCEPSKFANFTLRAGCSAPFGCSAEMKWKIVEIPKIPHQAQVVEVLPAQFTVNNFGNFSNSEKEDVHQGKQVQYDEFHHKSSPREITVDPPTLLDSVLLVTEKAKCKLCIYDRSVDGQSSIPAADRLQNRLLVLFKLGNI
ncbi:hypothetical protein T01_8856 [Trichinella spiralis]|uniref:Uncharacterized protein n=1 Tax=Trichinella spiralis TaxID=6334 RepID=A0A0V1BAC6_TRISP|nr:hypothetical protein T01_8856 [Trichinella spiralis]